MRGSAAAEATKAWVDSTFVLPLLLEVEALGGEATGILAPGSERQPLAALIARWKAPTRATRGRS